jgi:hypothetical protein
MQQTKGQWKLSFASAVSGDWRATLPAGSGGLRLQLLPGQVSEKNLVVAASMQDELQNAKQVRPVRPIFLSSCCACSLKSVAVAYARPAVFCRTKFPKSN